jgi:proton-coupled amino acid transporter
MSDYHSINGLDSASEGLDAEAFEGEIAESRKRTTGTVRSIFNILKTYIGVGVLGLPNAWKESGVVLALVSMLALSLISLHCLNLLVDSKEQLIARGERVFTFGDVTKKAFGRFGRVGAILVDVILCFCQLGVCASYIAFLGQNTQSLLAPYTKLPWHVFAAIWICIMMLLSWIRTLKSLAPLATIATGCLAAGLVAITAAACMSLNEAVQKHTFVKPVLADWKNLPAMISVAVFAFEGIGFVIPAQTAIKDPKRYPFVLTFCIIVVGTLYAIFGTIVYVGFGQGTEDQIIQSLLNWSQGSKGWKIGSEIITVGLILAIALTYPIQLFVATDLIEERIFPPKDKGWGAYWIRNNFRAFLVFCTGLLALTLSQLDVIMGFIGSIGASPLQFIFPPIIWLSINWREASIPKKALIFFYLFFGVAVTILGTASNIGKLIKKK